MPANPLNKELSRLAKKMSSLSKELGVQTTNDTSQSPIPSFEFEKTSAAKGAIGEHLIADTIEFANIKGEAKLWLNVLVPKARKADQTTELDVIMLHQSGIYVFESKNYSGWIFGREDEQYWTQSLNKNVKTRFYNPVKQNTGHIKQLSRSLSVPAEYFVSYIIFSDKCKLQKVPSGTTYRILTYHGMLPALKQDLETRTSLINMLQMRTLAERIEELSMSSTSEAQEAHMENIKQAQGGTICPYCGADLVERTGPYSRFLGCSNYPRCKYTRSIQKNPTT